MKYPICALVVAALAATPSASKPAAGAEQKASDPNERICQSIEVIGSRLAKKRVCLTRSQWAERREEDRQNIERVQVRRGSCEGCQ